MSSSEKAPETRDEVDRLVTDLLESSPTERNVQPLEELSAVERTRAADLLLVDALLVQLSGRQSDHVGRLLSESLRRIDEQSAEEDLEDRRSLQTLSLPTPPPVPTKRRPASWLPISIAAAVLIAASVFWLQPAHNRAYAAVVKAYHAALADITREYRVTIERNGPVSGTSEAKLWVRGGTRFVLSHPGPLPGNFWIGDDGRERWLVPVVGPVLVTEEPTAALGWLRDRDESLPLLQLSTMLKKLSRDYEIQLTDEHHVLGNLRTPARFLPEEVRATLDDSGVIEELTLIWPASEIQPGPRVVTLKLIGEDTVGEEWFSHKAHHDPRRPVVHAPRFTSE